MLQTNSAAKVWQLPVQHCCVQKPNYTVILIERLKPFVTGKSASDGIRSQVPSSNGFVDVSEHSNMATKPRALYYHWDSTLFILINSLSLVASRAPAILGLLLPTGL